VHDKVLTVVVLSNVTLLLFYIICYLLFITYNYLLCPLYYYSFVPQVSVLIHSCASVIYGHGTLSYLDIIYIMIYGHGTLSYLDISTE